MDVGGLRRGDAAGLEETGAVGELLMALFDVTGRWLRGDLEDRTIVIDVARLDRTR